MEIGLYWPRTLLEASRPNDRADSRDAALRPGDQLPSEEDLAARYDVAHSTAHRAVALLAEEGLSTSADQPGPLPTQDDADQHIFTSLPALGESA